LAAMRRPSTDSTGSLPGIAAAATSASKRKDHLRFGDLQGSYVAQQSERHHPSRHGDSSHPLARAESLGPSLDSLTLQPQQPLHPPPSPNSLPANSSAGSLNNNPNGQSGTTHRRSAPPTPSKRRKPPAVPQQATERTNSGATITAIASSNPTSIGKPTKSNSLPHALA